jgi:hypothetical protein
VGSAAKRDDMRAPAVLASRYCDVCGGMPWWAQPLLIVIGFAIAIAILAGFVRLSAWLSQRRLPPK